MAEMFATIPNSDFRFDASGYQRPYVIISLQCCQTICRYFAIEEFLFHLRKVQICGMKATLPIIRQEVLFNNKKLTLKKTVNIKLNFLQL